MTDQEIFDLAYTRVVAQGKPARTNAGNCLYRTEDGLRCAAGQIMKGLVPEDSTLWDSEGALYSLRRKAGSDGLPWNVNQDCLVAEIQGAHDDVLPTEFVREFKEKMENLAERHGLTAPA